MCSSHNEHHKSPCDWLSSYISHNNETSHSVLCRLKYSIGLHCAQKCENQASASRELKVSNAHALGFGSTRLHGFLVENHRCIAWSVEPDWMRSSGEDSTSTMVMWYPHSCARLEIAHSLNVNNGTYKDSMTTTWIPPTAQFSNHMPTVPTWVAAGCPRAPRNTHAHPLNLPCSQDIAL